MEHSEVEWERLLHENAALREQLAHLRGGRRATVLIPLALLGGLLALLFIALVVLVFLLIPH